MMPTGAESLCARHRPDRPAHPSSRAHALPQPLVARCFEPCDKPSSVVAYFGLITSIGAWAVAFWLTRPVG